MLTITATPDPNRYSIALEVTGSGGAYVKITAEPVGRAPYTVRPIGTSTADPLRLSDHEAPFGVQIRYTAETSTESSSILAAPLEVSGCVLSDTLRPGSSVPVSLLADRPHEWEARSAWFDVIDRRDPLVTVGPMRYRAGEWQFYAFGNTARAALLALLLPGSPLLLRTSNPEVVDDVIGLPLRVAEDPHVSEFGGRVFTVRYQGVTRTLGPFVGAGDWTYADLADHAPTYAALLPEFVTYRDLYAGPSPAPLEARSSSPAAWGVAC